MEPSQIKEKKALTKLAMFLRVCRWIGYVVVFMLMSDAPPWAVGIVLAIVLKRTNVFTIS